MDKITFENATLVNPAKVTIDSVDYEVTPEETTGGTPASASTFNTMQSNIEKSVVAVNSSQPSTSEKVWIKKGNNIYNEETMLEFTGKYRAGNSGNIITSATNKGLKIPTEPNTTYTITQTGASDYHEVCFFDKNFNYLSGIEAESTQITTPANCYIMTIQANINATDIMINKGSTALPYEEYVNKEILVQNDNNIFEELYKEEEIQYNELKVSTYFSTVEINKVIKTGNVVVVEFRGYVNTSIPGNTNFLELPWNVVESGTGTGFVGGQYDTTTPVWFYYIKGGNALNCEAINSGNWFHLHFVCICK